MGQLPRFVGGWRWRRAGRGRVDFGGYDIDAE